MNISVNIRCKLDHKSRWNGSHYFTISGESNFFISISLSLPPTLASTSVPFFHASENRLPMFFGFDRLLLPAENVELAVCSQVYNTTLA